MSNVKETDVKYVARSELRNCDYDHPLKNKTCTIQTVYNAVSFIWQTAMSHLISFNPLLFINIAYVGYFKHFVFVYLCIYVNFYETYGLYGLKHYTVEKR